MRSRGVATSPTIRMFVPQIPDGPRHREEESGQHGQRCRAATLVSSERRKNRQRQRDGREHQQPDYEHDASILDRPRGGTFTGSSRCAVTPVRVLGASADAGNDRIATISLGPKARTQSVPG